MMTTMIKKNPKTRFPYLVARGLVYRRFIVCFIVNKTTKYIVYKLPTHSLLRWMENGRLQDRWYLRVWVQKATCQALQQDLCLNVEIDF